MFIYIIKYGLNYCTELDELDLESTEKISLVMYFDIALFWLYAPYLCDKLAIKGFKKNNDPNGAPLILISANDGLNIDNSMPESLKYLTIQFNPIDIDISSSETDGASERLEDAHIDNDEFRANILNILQAKIHSIEDIHRRDRLASLICNQLDL